MKKIYAFFVVFGALFSPLSHAQVLFNASVGAEFAPGVYGQINVGNTPPPPLVNQQPILAGSLITGAPPMYVYVPFEQTQNWALYCAQYRACGVPTYFIQYDVRHPFWARYHEMHHIPYRGPAVIEERREPMYQERRDERREERRDERREHEFEQRR